MEFIVYEQKGGYGVITINREKALNALNSAVLEELDATLDAVNLDEVRCLILTGAGSKSFVAGADIGEMSTLTKAQGEAFGKKGNDVFRKLETFPVPVIAAVNGFALGGGCEISMSCDIRICSENAVFGQPEVGLGITPGFGGTQRLARLVGAGMAKQMIYTARNIKADEAYRIGLVNAVYPQEELMAAAEKMAAILEQKGCPKAEVIDLCRCDQSQAVEAAFRCGRLVAMSSTYDGGLFPPMEHFMAHLRDKTYRNRTVAVIENGSWAPAAAKCMTACLTAMKGIALCETVHTIQGAVKESDLAAMERIADELLA